MRSWVILCLILLLIGGVGIFLYRFFQDATIINPLSSKKTVTELPLEKYSFDRLRTRTFTPSPITLIRLHKKTDRYTSFVVAFLEEGKKVSSLMNVPVEEGTHPVIVLFRGYVDKEAYKTGIGTQRIGEVLAANGFITVSPDFLGYGESDNPSPDSIEERFQTYSTALTLLESIKNLNTTLEASYSGKLQVDTKRVGIWGHSNGGHIALSVLAITGRDYPTVLWNPVSKPFPYSVLYFTDEFDDHGKALRKVVADFEKHYDIEKYSPSNFYQLIQAPIQLHQGEADEAVPLRWSEQLYTTLNDLEKDINYFTYPGADHNLAPFGWSEAVSRSINFYRAHFTQ